MKRETPTRRPLRALDAVILGAAAYLVMWLVYKLGMMIDRIG